MFLDRDYPVAGEFTVPLGFPARSGSPEDSCRVQEWVFRGLGFGWVPGFSWAVPTLGPKGFRSPGPVSFEPGV